MTWFPTEVVYSLFFRLSAHVNAGLDSWHLAFGSDSKSISGTIDFPMKFPTRNRAPRLRRYAPVHISVFQQQREHFAVWKFLSQEILMEAWFI